MFPRNLYLCFLSKEALIMKKLIPALALLSTMGLYSCSEDFEVAAPYKQITVAYGVLDMADTAHYIRVQKAFMDEHKSAIDMSKEPDSSFYSQLDVKVVEYLGNNITNTITLQKVDLNNEGYYKQSSVKDQSFFTTPHYGYKFKHQLNPSRDYRFIITNPQTGKVDSSDRIGIVSNDTTDKTKGFDVNEFNYLNFTLNFSRTTQTAKTSFFVNTPTNGYILEGYIRFHYVEQNTVTNATERRSVDYNFSTLNTEPTSAYQPSVQNLSILAYLRAAMGVAPANTVRYMDSCDVYFYAGSKELYSYTFVTQSQGSSLTNDNIQPNYTNMLTEDALGVIGSRASRYYYNAAITEPTLDTLMNNEITRELNIRGRTTD